MVVYTAYEVWYQLHLAFVVVVLLFIKCVCSKYVIIWKKKIYIILNMNSIRACIVCTELLSLWQLFVRWIWSKRLMWIALTFECSMDYCCCSDYIWFKCLFFCVYQFRLISIVRYYSRVTFWQQFICIAKSHPFHFVHTQ